MSRILSARKTVVNSTSLSSPPDNDLRRRLQRGGMWVVSGRSLGMLVVFASDWVFARTLASGQYAAYVHALALVTISSLVAMFGLHMLVCRVMAASFAVGDGRGAGRSLRRILCIAAVTIVGTGSILGGSLPYLARTILNRPALGDAAVFIAIWVSCLAASQILAETFRGLHNLFAASLFGGVSGGLVANASLLLLAVLYAWTIGPLTFGVLAVLAPLSFVVPLIVMSIWLLLRWPGPAEATTDPPPAWSRMSTGLLLIEAAPIMFLQLASHGMDQVGQFTLGSLGPEYDQQLAIYHVLWRIAFVGLIPFTMIGLVIASSVSEAHAQQNRQVLQGVIRGASTAGLVLATPFLLLLILIPGPILALFKPEFAIGASSLALLAVIQWIRNWLGPCHLVLVMTGHQRAAFLCYLAASPILLAGPWAARSYGLFGITCVAAAASTLPRVLHWWVVKRQLEIEPRASLDPRYLRQLTRDGLRGLRSPTLAEGVRS